MILQLAMTIIICFKEIYSWNNVFISLLLISSIIVFVSSQQLGNDKVGNATLHEDVITTLSSLLQEETTLSKSNFIRPTVFREWENSSSSTSGLPDSSTSTSLPSFNKSFVLNLSTIKSDSIANENYSSIKHITTANETKNYSALELTTAAADFNSFTKVENLSSSTVITPSVKEQSSSMHFIVISIAVIIIIALIAYGIYHYYRKEQVRRLRLQLMPVYNFDPTESDDWESNLLEEECNTLRQNNKTFYNSFSSSL